MKHLEYINKYKGSRVDFDSAYGYQCVDLARHYCGMVWWYLTKVFGGSAYKWWENRATTFAGKRCITGFPNDASDIKTGDIVIFKPSVFVETKAPGSKIWKRIKLTTDGHVWVIDYIDNDGILRIVEQNGGNGNGNWLGANAIRLWGYKWKDAIAWFILQ